jgi:hypothetical protein
METKFSKGPWSVGYNCYNVTADEGNMNVCDIRGWGYLTGQGSLALEPKDAVKIQNSNAHLIAASPELYEALEKCLEVFYCGRSKDSAAYNEAQRLTKLALAKARGEIQSKTETNCLQIHTLEGE